MGNALNQAQLDWLLKQGVPAKAISSPWALLSDGNGCIVIPDGDGYPATYWNPRTGQLLGEWCIGEPYSQRDPISDWSLTIHADPLAWLKTRREGVVIVDWRRIFDELRDVPRVSLPATLADKWRKHMRPVRLPDITIR